MVGAGSRDQLVGAWTGGDETGLSVRGLGAGRPEREVRAHPVSTVV